MVAALQAMWRRASPGRRLWLGSAALIALAAAASAQEVSPSPAAKQRSTPQSQPAQPQTLTGDWGGLRTKLHDMGVDISSGIKEEALGKVYGGLGGNHGAQAGEFDLGATLDGAKLWNTPGGVLQITLTQRWGEAPPGDLLQQSAEVYGRGNILRLTEFWYRQKLFDDHLTIKFGRVPQGDFNSFTCDFVNLTFCGSPEGNLRGDIWYNWPIAQWTAWARYDFGDYDLMAGVNEVNPHDLDLQFSPAWFNGATGAMGHVELGWTPSFGPGKLVGHYQAGVWDSTAPSPDVLLGRDGRPFALTGETPVNHDSYGWYAQGIQQLTGTATYDRDVGYKNKQGLGVFFNYTAADRATSTLDSQITAGFTYAGPFPSRPDDAFGVAVGRTHYNGRAAQAILAGTPGVEVPRSEYPIEAFYSIQATPWWDVRPDVQYIVHPGGFASLRDEVQIGVRTDVKF
jgi:porin